MEPTREDYIAQIKGDLETDSGESKEVLEDRLSRVEAAKTNEDAKTAYFKHVEGQE